MSTRPYGSLLAVVAIPLALGITTPASASIFDSIGKAAKSVGGTAGNFVKGASKTVSDVGWQGRRSHRRSCGQGRSVISQNLDTQR